MQFFLAIGHTEFHTGSFIGNTPIKNNLDSMQQAFEAAGVRVVFDARGKAAGIAVDDAGRGADQKGNSP